MAFNHRKLISDTDYVNITAFCQPFCEPTDDSDQICPPICLSRCYHPCVRLITSLIPRPPDPPISASNHHPDKNQILHHSLIISLSLLATFCILFCSYTVYKHYKRRHSSGGGPSQAQQEETHDDFLNEDQGPVLDHPIWYIRTVGLQPSIINLITVCKYKRGDGLVEGTECSVCLNEFQEDETLRLLPKCNHAFHIPCIDTWLRSHTNCPMCRAGIVTNPTGPPTPVPDQSADNSIIREETQVVVVSESRGEFRAEREERACEVRLRTEEEAESEVENTEKSPETSGFQPMRRSVSVESLSASIISSAIANAYSGESDRNSAAQLVRTRESNFGRVNLIRAC